jgi:hypothetical protein
VEDIRRITNNWPEYGGVVIGNKAAHRNPLDYDPNAIVLNPDRAVFDVAMLKMVGQIQLERTHRAPDRGHARSDFPYPLAGLTYCAHCDRLAEQQNNPKLRSRLGGKTKSRYRHRAGHPCGCTKKSVSREIFESDFLRLMKLITVKPEMMSRMEALALSANSMGSHEAQDMEAKKAASIAKCRRKIEAARHLYEDGDISRQEYIRRKDINEREITHWQSFTTEVEKVSVELAMCLDVVDKIVRLWEVSNDEDKQGLVRHLFDYITYDLDKKQIVDFQLKEWASRYLIVRYDLYRNDADTSEIISEKGTNTVFSPVGTTMQYLT